MIEDSFHHHSFHGGTGHVILRSYQLFDRKEGNTSFMDLLGAGHK
jgi:hypothetical protein